MDSLLPAYSSAVSAQHSLSRSAILRPATICGLKTAKQRPRPPLFVSKPSPAFTRGSSPHCCGPYKGELELVQRTNHNRSHYRHLSLSHRRRSSHVWSGRQRRTSILLVQDCRRALPEVCGPRGGTCQIRSISAQWEQRPIYRAGRPPSI